MPVQIWIVGGGFILMGLSSLVRPGFTVGFFGAHADTADFRNEIRAVYGGFGIFVGGFLLAAGTALEAQSDGILLAYAVALAGMAAGRLISFAIERTGKWPLFFTGVEVVGAAALYAAVGS